MCQAEAEESRLLGTATTPARIREIVTRQNVTTNLHHDGVAPKAFSRDGY